MTSDGGTRRVTRASSRASSAGPTTVGPSASSALNADVPAHNTRASSRAPSAAGSARSTHRAEAASQAHSVARSTRSAGLRGARSAMASTTVPGSVAGPSRNTAASTSGRETLTTYGDQGTKGLTKTEADFGLTEFEKSLNAAGVASRTGGGADLSAIDEEDAQAQDQLAASLHQSVDGDGNQQIGNPANTTGIRDFEDHDRTFSAEVDKARAFAAAIFGETWRVFKVLKWLSIFLLLVLLLADVYRGPIFGDKYDLLRWRSDHTHALQKPLSFSSTDMSLFANRLEELVKADTGLFSNRLEELVAADTNRLEQFVAAETTRLEEVIAANIDLFSRRLEELGVADKNRLEELVMSNMNLFSTRHEQISAENLAHLFNHLEEVGATNLGLLSVRLEELVAAKMEHFSNHLEELGEANKKFISNHVKELDAANKYRLQRLVADRFQYLSYTDTPKVHKINWFSPGLGALTAPHLSSPTKIMNRTYEQGPVRRSTWLPFTFSSWISYLGLKAGTKKLSYEVKEYRGIQEAILPWHDVGDCWCAPSTRGKLQLAVVLPRPIAPTELVIEHVPAGELHDIGSVPKEVELWVSVKNSKVRRHLKMLVSTMIPDIDKPISQRGKGKDTVKDLGETFIPIGRWDYDVNSFNNVQTFPIDFNLSEWSEATDRAVVRVNSNWGSKNETCLYRVKLHGKARGGGD